LRAAAQAGEPYQVVHSDGHGTWATLAPDNGGDPGEDGMELPATRLLAETRVGARGTLQGPPAARVVRALVDFTPPVTIPELVRRSGASTGATYRVVEFLEREALIERIRQGTRHGPIKTVDWRRLLERWSEDYGFQRSNTVGAYLQPRGLDAVLDGLAASHGLRYALTGSLAARRLAPYAPSRLAMIYVDDPAQTAAQLTLRPVDSGANVLLAVGDYDVVFDRRVEVDNLSFAAPSQTAVTANGAVRTMKATWTPSGGSGAANR
jgi:hypothetical protein